MKRKLRLLVTKDCPKNCEGCCNKDWNLDKLPVVDHYNYDEILITGGEPLNGTCYGKTQALLDYLNYVDTNSSRRVYVYTSDPMFTGILWSCDGVTVSLHTQEDADEFFECSLPRFNNAMSEIETIDGSEVANNKCNRLNIFKGIKIPKDVDLNAWEVKKDIEWIPNCPLPEDEVFMKLPNI